MLQWIVGNVDANSAAVLIMLSVCLCVAGTALIVRRRTKVDVEHEFELAKMKLRDAREAEAVAQKSRHELAMARLAADTDVNIKRIDSGMITSHTSRTEAQTDG